MSGKPWTDADLRTLRTLRGFGNFSNEHIGKQLDPQRSAKAVSAKGCDQEREERRVTEAKQFPSGVSQKQREAA